MKFDIHDFADEYDASTRRISAKIGAAVAATYARCCHVCPETGAFDAGIYAKTGAPCNAINELYFKENFFCRIP